MRKSSRGTALVVVLALVTVALGVLMVIGGMMLQAARRASARLESEVRQVRCQADLTTWAAPPWEAAGRPVVEDPAYPWTAPPGRGEDLQLDGGVRLRYVPAGDDAFVYLDAGGGVSCVGDRATP